jgi:hypothetical protein
MGLAVFCGVVFLEVVVPRLDELKATCPALEYRP